MLEYIERDVRADQKEFSMGARRADFEIHGIDLNLLFETKLKPGYYLSPLTPKEVWKKL